MKFCQNMEKFNDKMNENDYYKIGSIFKKIILLDANIGHLLKITKMNLIRAKSSHSQLFAKFCHDRRRI